MSGNGYFECASCPNKFHNMKLYITHLQIIHKAKINIKCGKNCKKIYNTYTGLKKHMTFCTNDFTNVRNYHHIYVHCIEYNEYTESIFLGFTYTDKLWT